MILLLEPFVKAPVGALLDPTLALPFSKLEHADLDVGITEKAKNLSTACM